MIQITDKSQCCGCTACANICTHNAIIMQPDTLGFLYPVIDITKCVNCGLCEKVCAFNINYDTTLNLIQPLAYAARHKNIKEIETSRSGAAFIAISDYILENGGVIYGAGYTDHFRVIHKRATTKQERDEFKGSKYVQSDLNYIFREVKKDLKNGTIVLFSGTPCQTAGLAAYIGKTLRKKLLLVDIVCHGVPSPYIWRDYLTFIEKKEKSKICKVNFRDKEKFGWTAHKETFKFTNKKETSEDYFTYLFNQHIIFRHSCQECYFTNLKRPSDITIADFWGWEKSDPTFNADDKGASLILINTERGKEVFKEVNKDLTIFPVKLNNCIQPNLQHPSIMHPKRLNLENDYMHNGFTYILKKYGNYGWEYHIRRFLRKIKILIKHSL